jgi:hypothetical protein
MEGLWNWPSLIRGQGLLMKRRTCCPPIAGLLTDSTLRCPMMIRTGCTLGSCPKPFLGYHDAPVVVLMSNPGIDPADRTIDRSWLTPANRESLTAPNGTAIYSLSERVASTPGGIFWRSFTKGLLAARRDYEVLARRILAVQLHGYHSRRPGRPRETLPSQHFQFSLVRSAMNRKAVIIVAYGGPSWYMHLPELRRYDKTVIKVSPQTRSIGLGNLTPEGRRLVMAALDK